ncbi:MAG: nucleotide exchange factor GrpE [Phycisphaerales bacterium]|nr:nucleotide exchange factor GrpE [Phycisphaerales bacterium]
MNDTHDQTDDQIQNQEANSENMKIDQEQVEREEHAARMESIRQLAQANEIEVAAEDAEILDALLDTINQRDELQDKLLRAAADHQNFQRRATGNEREARTSATQGVVQSLIPLLDTFEMALLQDPEKVTAEQVIEGVRMIRGEFLRLLSGYGVSSIDPVVGDEFNPVEHSAMMQQPADGVEPGHISLNMGMGFKLGERVVRPAKVAVVPSIEAEPATEPADSTES